jgi:CBS domain-containing protein
MAKAKDIMTTEVVTIDGSATVAQAIALMKKKNVRALIVDRRTASDAYGIVTQRDVAYKVLAERKDPKKVKISDIFSKPLLVVNPDLDVIYVARLMKNFKLSRAPVIFDGKVQGIVSVSDIVNKGT